MIRRLGFRVWDTGVVVSPNPPTPPPPTTTTTSHTSPNPPWDSILLAGIRNPRQANLEHTIGGRTGRLYGTGELTNAQPNCKQPNRGAGLRERQTETEREIQIETE